MILSVIRISLLYSIMYFYNSPHISLFVLMICNYDDIIHTSVMHTQLRLQDSLFIRASLLDGKNIDGHTSQKEKYELNPLSLVLLLFSDFSLYFFALGLTQAHEGEGLEIESAAQVWSRLRWRARIGRKGFRKCRKCRRRGRH